MIKVAGLPVIASAISNDCPHPSGTAVQPLPKLPSFGQEASKGVWLRTSALSHYGSVPERRKKEKKRKTTQAATVPDSCRTDSWQVQLLPCYCMKPLPNLAYLMLLQIVLALSLCNTVSEPDNLDTAPFALQLEISQWISKIESPPHQQEH